jgi:hypothetical protein
MLAAVLLADDGHEVTLLGRTSAHGPEEAAGTGAHHLLVPSVSALLERELPDVSAALVAHGGREQTLAGPAADGPRPVGVRVLSPFAVERALADAVERRPRVRRLTRSGADSVIMGNEVRTGRPHVRGVLADDGRALFADLCVDAGDVDEDDLLSAAGAHVAHGRVGRLETRLYTRLFVPAGPGGGLPAESPSLSLHHFDGLCVRVVRGTRPWSVTLCIAAADEELYGLAQPPVWDRVQKLLEPRLGLGGALPAEGVRASVMPRGVRRRMPVAGTPSATGFVRVGTAWALSHPLYGPQFSLGALHAVVLRDALRDTRTGDAADRTDRFEELTAAAISPVHHRMQGWELRLRGRTTVGGAPPLEGSAAMPGTRGLLRWIDRMERVTGAWQAVGPDRKQILHATARRRPVPPARRREAPPRSPTAEDSPAQRVAISAKLFAVTTCPGQASPIDRSTPTSTTGKACHAEPH